MKKWTISIPKSKERTCDYTFPKLQALWKQSWKGLELGKTCSDLIKLNGMFKSSVSPIYGK
jgi:hypothetical protein